MGQAQKMFADDEVVERHEDAGIDAWLTLLANSDRRAMVSYLASIEQADGASVGEIAFAAGISRFSASRHLQMLRQAGLVDTRKSGNRVIVTLVAEPFRLIDDWLWRLVNALGDVA